MREDEKTEFKREVTADVAREVAAFANTEGGTVYIGVADDGSAVGVGDVDAESLRVTNMLRDSIVPDVMELVHVRALDAQATSKMFGTSCGEEVIAIEVAAGSRKPYYLAKKGPIPAGVPVRRGPSSIPTTRDVILAMIRKTANYSYEEEVSVNQELGFSQLKAIFSRRHVKLGVRQMRSLMMRNEDGQYTNLAYILSDGCQLRFQVASFQGCDVRVFKDRKVFDGCILEQINKLVDYLEFRNETSGRISMPHRIEVRSYPDDALREAVCNMVMHRDYASKAINKVSVFDDRIEFHTAGGLAPGVYKDEVTCGTSVCRNPRLADLMFRLGLVEAYGTGLPRIFAAYEGRPVQPLVECSENVFRLTLPNINYAIEHGSGEKVEQVERAGGSALGEGRQSGGLEVLPAPRPWEVGEVRHMILNLIDLNGKITRIEVEKVLGCSRSSAGRLLEGMVSDGLIDKVGAARSTAYVLTGAA